MLQLQLLQVHCQSTFWSYCEVCSHLPAPRANLPISQCSSDNSWSFKNFMMNVLSIKAELWKTDTQPSTPTIVHSANTSKMMQHNRSSSRCFVNIMIITSEPLAAGYYLKGLLVQWLHTYVHVPTGLRHTWQSLWMEGTCSGGGDLVSNNQRQWDLLELTSGSQVNLSHHDIFFLHKNALFLRKVEHPV